MATQPEFISRNVDQIVSEMVAFYEGQTGKTLQPAQPERLLINAFAYREGLIREAIQDSAVQNLVEFSSAPVLDYLGDLVGVKRLAAAPATVTVRFTATVGHGDFTIPAGTRVSSNDGVATYEVITDTDVLSGDTYKDILCECIQSGILGNGYTAATITTLVDPVTGVDSVSNTTTSASGTDQESDDALRNRIKLAPASFSNAGSKGAYLYWAFTAHPSIIDVAVTSSTPGQVDIYPLTDAAVTPTPVLDAVSATCNGEKIRPLTDTVVVHAPTAVDYDIQVDLTLFNWAVALDVQAAVEAALTEFATSKRRKMGVDIVVSQLLAVCMIDGVYDAEVVQPSTGFTVAENEFPNLINLNVNIVGTTAG